MLVRSGRGALAATLGAAVMLAAASPASGAVAHVVQPGESLWSVASANGISVESLAAYNGLSSNSQLIAAETIQVPTASETGTTTSSSGTAGHVVAPGESLWSIASANGVTVDALAAANGLSSDALLIVGQTIQIPTTSTSATAASHVVAPGESLWSIASANGITVDALAAANGLSSDALLIVGQSLQIPAATSATSTSGLGQIYSPYGPAQLAPAAASSWNSMRDASLSQYGADLYPGGPLSAYRTYDQQAYLYDQYLSGKGAPANPPGTSTHELGIAVDVATASMRSIIDQIGGAYGWMATIPTEWWHVQYVG
jgi:LysM repeat protein